MISIQFPVDPHVKKYLIKKVGESVDLSGGGAYETMIIDLLNRKTIRSSDRNLPSDRFLVEIKDHWLFKRFGTLSINKSLFLEFNKRVDQAFKDELESICRIYINDPKLINTVRMYFEYYEINESDFKMDTILKYLKRHGIIKKDLKKRTKKHSHQMSLK